MKQLLDLFFLFSCVVLLRNVRSPVHDCQCVTWQLLASPALFFNSSTIVEFSWLILSVTVTKLRSLNMLQTKSCFPPAPTEIIYFCHAACKEFSADRRLPEAWSVALNDSLLQMIWLPVFLGPWSCKIYFLCLQLVQGGKGLQEAWRSSCSVKCFLWIMFFFNMEA